MSLLLRGTTTVFGVLLRLFPLGFRKEFGEEMKDVFSESVEEAIRRSLPAFLWVCFLELVDLPVNAYLQHLTQRKKEKDYMDKYHAQLKPVRSAQLGALGFGIGFLIWVIVALNIKPVSSQENPFILAGVKTLVEAALMSIVCALGGLMLSLSNPESRRRTWRIVLAMAGGGALGRLILFPLEYAIYAFHGGSLFTEGWLTPILFFLLSGIAAGSFLGLVARGRQEVGRSAWIGGLAFGIGIFLIILFNQMEFYWSVFLYALPLYVFSRILAGAVIGAIFGWYWGKEILVRPVNSSIGSVE